MVRRQEETEGKGVERKKWKGEEVVVNRLEGWDVHLALTAWFTRLTG